MNFKEIKLIIKKEGKKRGYTGINPFIYIFPYREDYVGIFDGIECRIGLIKWETERVNEILDELESISFYLKDQEYENIYKRSVSLNELKLHQKDYLELIILPTEKCNFRCIYCYENFKKGKMSAEVQEGIKKLIKNNIENNGVKNLFIQWFGGEPLLAFDIITKLSDFFIKITSHKGVNYFASITTNGYLLDYKTFEKCLTFKIKRFQITIDGPGNTHDERRKLSSGKGTWNKIWNNLLSIKKCKCKDFEVIIRINIDYGNLPYISHFLDLCERHFAHDPRFKFYFRCIFGPAPSLRLIETTESYKVLWKLYKELQKRNLFFNWSLQSFSLGSFVCYAAKPYSFVIGSDGTVYKCTVYFEHKENMVGYIKQDGKLELNKNYLLWIYPFYNDIKKCKKCAILNLCQNRQCPAQILINKNMDCGFKQYYFLKYVKEYIKYRHKKYTPTMGSIPSK